jgi:hydroxyacylglutathione hydrolase
MKLLALPAFNDNYLWLWHDEHEAIVVDPGQAQPVMDALAGLNLKLNAILVTHHHKDHVGGIEELKEKTHARIYGPDHPAIPRPDQVLKAHDRITLLGRSFEVFEVPGHTLTHLAYLSDKAKDEEAALLFCGDTLFSGGCGRLFEGTPQQMLNSLEIFKSLAPETLVCCAHEYTLSNLKFALHIEPHNQALLNYNQHCQMLRAQHQPTLPSNIGVEKEINPFLRAHLLQVQQAAQAFDARVNDELSCFAALREWKNNF